MKDHLQKTAKHLKGSEHTADVFARVVRVALTVQLEWVEEKKKLGQAAKSRQ